MISSAITGGVQPLGEIISALEADPEWYLLSRKVQGDAPTCSVHLAVFIEPYLSYVLDGKKTVESRFSVVRFPPYGRVHRGDLVLLKRSGGPIVGVCEIGAAWFYDLEPGAWSTIRREFTAALCAEDPEFWRSREGAEYATLMYVSRVKRISPVGWPKKDRRGWVVVRARRPLSWRRMERTVLAFSGGIASGKSTLSEAVAQALGCSRVSFGTYLRAEARRRGLPVERGDLQKLGEGLVREDVAGLCTAVLAQALWSPGGALVIDGVRHAVVAQSLRVAVGPSDFRLVHVAADSSTRASRLTARGEPAEWLKEYDSHETEADVAEVLPRMADLVVDGQQSIESLIEEVAAWAESLP